MTLSAWINIPIGGLVHYSQTEREAMTIGEDVLPSREDTGNSVI
ncbi:hypothetical protein [Nitrosomonas ureae]|nr:hypothetical protein [Nitrosomonas ureae]